VVELEAAEPAPAVKLVAKYGGNRRVVPIFKMSHFFIVGRTLDVPREENLTSRRVHQERNVLQTRRRHNPQRLRHITTAPTFR
jgi:hypothetical protein